MPTNPTDQKAPTIPQAVKQLRLKLGDTQQQFAQRLDLAISTVVRYESTRPPRAEVLSRLYKLAIENNLHDVAAMFHEAIIGEVSGGLATGFFPLEDHERVIAGALVGILRNAYHLPELRKPCRSALRAIGSGYRLIEKRHEAGAMIFPIHEDFDAEEFRLAIKALEEKLKEPAL